VPWMDKSLISRRHELVVLATSPQEREGDRVNVRELCRRRKVSRKTLYKWIERYKAGGIEALADRSRKPHSSPTRTGDADEARVVELRKRHPAWGGRKISRRLADLASADDDAGGGETGVPAPSTITGILRRHGLLDPQQSRKHSPWTRFERERPNDLWQMDFKGHFPLGAGPDSPRCHPLSVLDDHSRFCVGLRACRDEREQTVRRELVTLFRAYGLPDAILCDNGPPWGWDDVFRHTMLTAWLIRLGIRVAHGRPKHPQTQGKDERFHRTLKAEVLVGRVFDDAAHAQRAFDDWRDVYNLRRPHEALALATPATRYRHSDRPYPEELVPIEYGPDDVVRKVNKDGYFGFKGGWYKVSQAFARQPIALRHPPVGDAAADDAQMDVFFCQEKIARIDLKRGKRIWPPELLFAGRA
jgi:transposase InsO family protein